MNLSVIHINASENEVTSAHEEATFHIDEQGNLLIVDRNGFTIAAYSRHVWRVVN